MGNCCGCGDLYSLRVKVLKAEGFGDKYDFFGTLDAFVQLEYNGKKLRTKAIKNNQNPKWNEILEFEGAELGHILYVKVYDWDRFKPNDYVGETILKDVLPTKYNAPIAVNFTVRDKEGKESGRIYVTMEFSHIRR